MESHEALGGHPRCPSGRYRVRGIHVKRRIMRVVPKKIRKGLSKFLFPKYIYQGSLFSPMTASQRSPLTALSKKGPWLSEHHVSLTSHSLFGEKIREPRKIQPSQIVAGVYGNFGNQIFEAACAAYVAKSLGVGTITVRDSGVFKPGLHDLGGVTMAAPEAKIVTPTLGRAIKARFRPHPERHLFGAFFLNWAEQPYAHDPAVMTDIYSGLREALTLDLSGEVLDDDDLTVSFRGGDAFSSRPLNHFGQPPLSYYQLVAGNPRWKHVRVISDDWKNPTLKPFLAWLEAKEVSHEYLDQDWESDVRTVFHSRNVLASRGTFVPAITAISPHVNELFFFDELRCPVAPEKSRIVKDADGEFVRKVFDNNWDASQTQCKLLVSYPQSKLCADF